MSSEQARVSRVPSVSQILGPFNQQRVIHADTSCSHFLYRVRPHKMRISVVPRELHSSHVIAVAQSASLILQSIVRNHAWEFQVQFQQAEVQWLIPVPMHRET